MKTNMTKLFSTSLALAALLGLAAVPTAQAATETIKGEVVDLMCYLDHGAKGDKHAECAETCIKSGGPVGILTADNQLYLVVGDHKPMNDKLAPLAGKTISLKGKVSERNGMKLIANAEIEK